MPSARVVKNGSQTCDMTSGAIPRPLSRMTSRTHLPPLARPPSAVHVASRPEIQRSLLSASRRSRSTRSPRSACSSCIGSTRTSGSSERQVEPKLDLALSQQFGEARQQALHQLREPLDQRAVRRGAGEAQQMADPAVEPVHLLDDRVELFPRGRRLGMPPGELRRGAEARERVPHAVRHRGRHLADGRELARLDQLRLGALELLRHPGERAREVADLVLRRGADRVIEPPASHHGHGAGQLAEGPGQASGDEPGEQEPEPERQRDDARAAPGSRRRGSPPAERRRPGRSTRAPGGRSPG